MDIDESDGLNHHTTSIWEEHETWGGFNYFGRGYSSVWLWTSAPSGLDKRRGIR